VEQDDEVRAIVFTGAGRGFCSGADVTTMPSGGGQPMLSWEASPEEVQRGIHLMISSLCSGIRKLSKPTIAMVNGVAAGAGFGIALSCDIRIGSDKARFVLASNRIGLAPPLGLSWLLPRLVGYSKAAEICFTGRPIGAEEAEQIGMLNKVVLVAELEKETMALGEQIVKGPPIAIKMTKQLLCHELHRDLDTHLDIFAAYQVMCHFSEDHREGVAAWREKREPLFQGK